MNEKKWRLVDDHIIVGLINNFEAKQGLDEVMEEGMSTSSKAIARPVH